MTEVIDRGVDAWITGAEPTEVCSYLHPPEDEEVQYGRRAG